MPPSAFCPWRTFMVVRRQPGRERGEPWAWPKAGDMSRGEGQPSGARADANTLIVRSGPQGGAP